ncbi:YfcE family phosphodiesterase [Halobacteriales archaeon SW_7_71_33]|nr:MAG: YfcE family phosphodiesterase [Halobacteriales archaeon SW_7_71_33]
MVEIVVMSDTHVPSRADGLPDWVRDRVRAADHVVHAGDFDSSAAYADVESLADGLTAVAGNTDPSALGLPEVATVERGGVRVAVTHGHRAARGSYEDGLRRTALEADADVAVGGHTHRTLDRDLADVRLLNPGSATGAAPAREPSVMRLTATEGECTVDLERR